MLEGMKTKKIKVTFFLLAACVCAVAFSVYLYMKSIFPDSVDTDTFGHLFKINYLYHSLREGVAYPVYTEYWYNGIELFRYWPPLAYYAVTLLQFLTEGSVVNAFYLFAGVVYLLNMLGWFAIGKRESRFGIAFLMGNLYFFCPDNIRIFMAEGNIPRIFITSLLPFAFLYTWEVIHYKNVKKLVGLAVVVWLITTSHYMIAAMTGISIFIFCAVYSVMNREWRQWVLVTVDLVLAYLSAGIFLLPGLTGGGLTSQNSEASVATINQWAQEAVKSLDPFYRGGEGYMRSFYFGLSVFVIVVLGIIAANKKTGAGFITSLFIFVSTTTTASTVVRLLPMSQVFWMQRFVPMAMCLCFFSILLWKKLKKSVIILFTIGVVLDGLLTFSLLTETREQSIEEIVEQEMSRYLLSEAMEVTRNRLGILDNSTWGAVPSYYLSRNMNEVSVPYSFGWAYQGAETIDNIVNINQAAQSGFYEYVFDRFLELGDDTVLVDKKLIPQDTVEQIQKAAEQVGYALCRENDSVWLYHMEDVEGTFGITKQYKNLAIGEHAQVICYIYPQFGYGNSNVLEDYTVEDLAQYDKVYLSGFTYRDKDAAEKLLTDAADKGVEIYIDMQHIPTNELSGKAEFMGVYAQFVAFTEKFPILSTDNGSQFKLDFSTAGYDVWNTVYLSGASENLKDAYYDDVTSLTYVAQDGNSNITFLGFNAVYYYHENRMPELLTFLNEVFEETPGQICKSEIVPIEVTYEAKNVTIESPKDNVNTGVANLDCFVLSDGREKTSQNHLLTVNAGTTVYDVEYTDFALGAVASLVGIAGSIIYWIVLFKRYKRRSFVV